MVLLQVIRLTSSIKSVSANLRFLAFVAKLQNQIDDEYVDAAFFDWILQKRFNK